MKDTPVGLVVVSAGESRRLQLGKRKPYLQLAGREIFLHTLDVFEQVPCIINKVLVVNPKDVQEVKANWNEELDRFGVSAVVEGGASRQESVLNGVRSLDAECEWVAIHDAVRPFVRAEDITRTVQAAAETGAAILAAPMKETIKENRGGSRIGRTIPRALLWGAQTPQVFPREKYLEVSARAIEENWEVTDDAQLFELAGLEVTLVEGSYDNIKITTEADWRIAQGMVSTIGHLRAETK